MALSITSFSNENSTTNSTANSTASLVEPMIESEQGGLTQSFATDRTRLETDLLTDDNFSTTLASVSNQLAKAQVSSDQVSEIEGSNLQLMSEMGNQLPLFNDLISKFSLSGITLVSPASDIDLSNTAGQNNIGLSDEGLGQAPLSGALMPASEAVLPNILLSGDSAKPGKSGEIVFSKLTSLTSPVVQERAGLLNKISEARTAIPAFSLAGDIQKKDQFSTAILESRLVGRERLTLVNQDAKTIFEVAKSPIDNSVAKGEAGTQGIKAEVFNRLTGSALGVERPEQGSKGKELDFEPLSDVNKKFNKESKTNLSKLDLLNIEKQPQAVKRFLLDQDTGLTYSNSRINDGKINAQPILNNVPAIQTLPSQSNLTLDQSSTNLLQQGLSLRGEFSPNLANRVQWIYQQALSSAEILMDPPELGPLSVKLKTHQGETSILFQVNNSQTKDMIEGNMAKLREMLEQQGIQLGDAQVEHQDQNQSKDGQQVDKALFSKEVTISQDESPRIQSINLLDTYV